jgi:hypothetical protein
MTTAPRTDYPEPRTTNTGRGLSIAGAVCAVLALVLFPPVFGVLGLVLGLIGFSMKDRLGLYVAIASVICGVGGAILGAAVLHATHK